MQSWVEHHVLQILRCRGYVYNFSGNSWPKLYNFETTMKIEGWISIFVQFLACSILICNSEKRTLTWLIDISLQSIKMTKFKFSCYGTRTISWLYHVTSRPKIKKSLLIRKWILIYIKLTRPSSWFWNTQQKRLSTTYPTVWNPCSNVQSWHKLPCDQTVVSGPYLHGDLEVSTLR